jgi:hypothetical protein
METLERSASVSRNHDTAQKPIPLPLGDRSIRNATQTPAIDGDPTTLPVR